ncbi:hypothetical protein EAG_15808 [Camponotus floridanus]|uniref:Uncharacterized protein n=1 Tax=Camponotus floridanus TaxID=104421 RepID=E2AUF6_CAMFO|nr:hypothetical protein EAG_15808 [Camponotus floridanus]
MKCTSTTKFEANRMGTLISMKMIFVVEDIEILKSLLLGTVRKIQDLFHPVARLLAFDGITRHYHNCAITDNIYDSASKLYLDALNPFSIWTAGAYGGREVANSVAIPKNKDPDFLSYLMSHDESPERIRKLRVSLLLLFYPPLSAFILYGELLINMIWINDESEKTIYKDHSPAIRQVIYCECVSNLMNKLSKF